MARSFIALCTGCIGLVVASSASVARASDAEAPLSVQLQSTPRFAVQHRPLDGLALELGREVHWARLSLVQDLPFLADGQTLAPILPLAPGALDPHALLARPQALGSMASALGQLATGLSIFELRREGRLIRRHHLRPYVGFTSVRITWRIDF